MHLSYSGMTVAKQCWRKYDWKYNKGLEPIEQGRHVKLGKIIHEAFELYYNGRSEAYVEKFIADSFAFERSRIELPDIEDMLISEAMAVGMWRAFPKDMRSFQEIIPERPFDIDVNGMMVVGRMDGLVKKDGRWWVREMKTTSLSHRQFKERMDVSEQASLYVWAARKLGYDVCGVVYDGLHKSLLRKTSRETAEEFASRITRDYSERPGIYFQREYVYKTDAAIEQFERDLVDFQRDVLIKKEHGGWYRNTNSCLSFGGECSYKKICFMDEVDELTLQLFYKQEDRDGQGCEEQIAG